MAQVILNTLAILSPLAALVFGYFSFYHARKKAEREEATQMATVMTKLESIGENVKDIKNEISGTKQDIGSLYERLARVEARLEIIEKH